jgi:hypothetical protein
MLLISAFFNIAQNDALFKRRIAGVTASISSVSGETSNRVKYVQKRSWKQEMKIKFPVKQTVLKYWGF